MLIASCSNAFRRARHQLSRISLFASRAAMQDAAVTDVRFQSPEAGMSLVSILTAVVIVTIFAAISYAAFSLSGAKSKALYDSMVSIAHSAEHFDLSLGTYPTVYGAMVNTTLGDSASNNTSGISLTNTWNGPYAKDKDISTSGVLHINNIASGATITFGVPPANIPGGLTYEYAVVANNIPPSIAVKAFNVCGGKTSTKPTGTEEAGQCVLVSGTLDTLYYVFAQNQYGPY